MSEGTSVSLIVEMLQSMKLRLGESEYEGVGKATYVVTPQQYKHWQDLALQRGIDLSTLNIRVYQPPPEPKEVAPEDPKAKARKRARQDRKNQSRMMRGGKFKRF